MKILIIGKFDLDSFGTHIAETLEDLGHEVVRVTKGFKYRHSKIVAFHKLEIIKNIIYRQIQASAYFVSKQKKIYNQIHSKAGKVDFILVTHDYLTPDEVTYLKKLNNCPVALWFPDAVVNVGKAMFLNANYDFLFFKDSIFVQHLNNDFPSKNVFYLPECCNPKYHKIYESGEKEIDKYKCDITNVGNCYANRVAFFDQFSGTSYKIKIWGNPPTSWLDISKIKHMLNSEYLTYRSKGLAFSNAKIVLNNLHPGEISSINARAFEIPAMGGFQIINHRDIISDLFIPGKEIETFKNFNELLLKIEFYLNHEQARKEIIAASQKRVYKDHTYEKRMLTILDKIFNL